MWAPLTRHTADLEEPTLTAVRSLLDDAFDSRFGDDDWEHTVGGLHTMVHDGEALVGHVSVVQRRLWLAGRPVRTGYVEGLGVAVSHRRRGIATALMAEAERVLDAAYDLGALSDGTGIDGFYASRGWQAWPGPTGVVTIAGTVRTPAEDGGVLVWLTPTSPGLDVAGTRAGMLACDERPGDDW